MEERSYDGVKKAGGVAFPLLFIALVVGCKGEIAQSQQAQQTQETQQTEQQENQQSQQQTGEQKCSLVFYKDADGDGYTDGTTQVSCTQPEGYVQNANPGDCDDSDPNINPDSREILNGIDDDCANGPDDGLAPSNLTYFFVSATQVGLRWQDNTPNEAEFVVQVATMSDFSVIEKEVIFPQDTTGGYVSGLQEGTTYWFRVYARNQTASTTYSDIISATTGSIYFEGAVQIALGGYHTCAIKSDGTLWCWGDNGFGQLGLGDTTDRYTPTQVMSGGVSQVALGEYHTCAVKTDGTLWCWGNNYSGQLGLGDTNNRYTPVQVTNGISQVSLGGSHTCVIKTDGSLWCWGRNNYGQLGLGDTTYSTTPSRVLSGSGGSSPAPPFRAEFLMGEYGREHISAFGSGEVGYGCSSFPFSFIIFVALAFVIRRFIRDKA